MTNYHWIVFSVSLRLLDKSNNQIITSMHLQSQIARCFLRRFNLQQQFGRVPLELASQSCWSKTLIYTWVGSSPSQGKSGQRLIDRYNLLLSYFSQERLIWSLYLLSASFIQFWAVTYLKWAWLTHGFCESIKVILSSRFRSKTHLYFGMFRVGVWRHQCWRLKAPEGVGGEFNQQPQAQQSSLLRPDGIMLHILTLVLSLSSIT